MKEALEDLAKKPKSFLFTLGLAFVLLLGGVDYFTGYEISFSIFYSIPVALVAWFVGGRWAISLSVISAATWLWADVTVGHQYSHPLIALWNGAMRMGYFLIITYALTALKKALEREKELSRTDSLTGIANGKYFYELAEGELYRSRRYNHPLTLAYLDLDDFKRVNDEYGHSEGDALLRVVATTLRKYLRLTDVVARLGGDEFAILLPETGFDEAKPVMDLIRKRLTEAMHQAKRHFPSTLSVGVVTSRDHEGTVDELIKIADGLMYVAKNKGKDRVEFGMMARE